IGLLTARLRRKNIVTLVLSVAFLFAYFYFYMNLQRFLGELVQRGEEIAAAFRQAMPPFYAFGTGAADQSLSGLLLFVLWSAVPFALTIVLLGRGYRKVLITNRGTARVEYREKAATPVGALRALLRKELAQYWSRPTVVLNTTIGALFMVVLSIFLLVKQADLVSLLLSFAPALGSVGLPALCAGTLVLLASMCNLSASLVSLEGRHLWIVRSIPVPSGTILLAKYCVHLLTVSLPCALASLCAGFAVAEGASDWLLLFLLPQASIAMMAAIGLVVNLRFPNFGWTNEIFVVKQGLSAMLSLFGGMAMVVVLVLLYAFLLRHVLAVAAFLWVCALVFAACAGVLGAWLRTAGARRFDAL
ncbi:MAG: hypothetical protein LBD12_06095, partial [Clostridiales Family XIII bacterium]|nr:hypothetical protein [Clostridiales Family XIII bacterium]